MGCVEGGVYMWHASGGVFDDDDDDDDDVFKGLDYPVRRNPENHFYQMFSLRFRALVARDSGLKWWVCAAYDTMQYNTRTATWRKLTKSR